MRQGIFKRPNWLNLRSKQKQQLNRADCEGLETRRLLAATMALDGNGTLTITVDPEWNSVIRISVDDGMLRAICRAEGYTDVKSVVDKSYSLSAVSSIDIYGGPASDDVQLDEDVAIDTTFWGAASGDGFRGGAGDDTYYGEDGDDWCYASLGSDTVSGGAGKDRINYNTVTITSAVSITLDGVANDGTTGKGDNILTDIEVVEGTSFNDLLDAHHVAYSVDLLGGGGDDILHGSRGGNDLLDGSYGNDYLQGWEGADKLIGGEGNDIVDYGDKGSVPVVVTLGVTGGDGVAGENDDVQNDVETIYGTGGNDRLDARSATLAVRMEGRGGNDTLYGSTRADTLLGGSGDDTLEGGDQNDFLDGGIGNDSLDGSAGNDTLEGGDGADNLVGGAGLDVVDYRSKGSGVRVAVTLDGLANDGLADASYASLENDNVASDIDVLIGSNGNDLLDAHLVTARIEVWGVDGDDILYGGAGNDHLRGGNGNDYLQGWGGSDDLYGEAGTDTIDYGDKGNAPVNVSLDNNINDGAVTIDGSGNRILVDYDNVHSDIEIVRGALGNDILDARGMTVPVYLYGLAGADTLFGGNGADTIDGGDGADILSTTDPNDILLNIP